MGEVFYLNIDPVMPWTIGCMSKREDKTRGHLFALTFQVSDLNLQS